MVLKPSLPYSIDPTFLHKQVIADTRLLYEDSFFGRGGYIAASAGLAQNRTPFHLIPTGKSELLSNSTLQIRDKAWSNNSQETVAPWYSRVCLSVLRVPLNLAEGLDSNIKLAGWRLSALAGFQPLKAKPHKTLPCVGPVYEPNVEKPLLRQLGRRAWLQPLVTHRAIFILFPTGHGPSGPKQGL